MSITDTSSDGPLAVYSVLPSGETPIPHGRSPASTDPITLSVAVSRTIASLLRPVLTYRNLPSVLMRVPIGRMPLPRSIVLTGTSRFTSIWVSVAPFSDGTYARLPSGVKAIERGRGPTMTSLSTFVPARSGTDQDH